MHVLCYTFIPIGFYDNIEGGTYGTVKKGVKRPLSNFNQKKIISTSTGYLVEVIPENVENDSDSDSEHVFSMKGVYRIVIVGGLELAGASLWAKE